MQFFKKHKKLKIVLLAFVGLFLIFLCIPVPKFDKPYSTVLTAKNGELLGAKIADDGQWRFPATDCYSPKYVACLLEYEDRWFFFHPGFNPVSFVKSFIDDTALLIEQMGMKDRSRIITDAERIRRIFPQDLDQMIEDIFVQFRDVPFV